MQTDVRSLSEVDHALDLHVPADEIQPQITDALKKERGQINLKGFRPGKVPMGVVRKMVGQQVAVRVAEEAIGEAYRTAVVENDEIEPIGQPRLVEMEFDVNDPEAALKAEIRFGTRPEIELAEMEGVPVTRFVHAFTDDEIEEDLQRRRDLSATLTDEDEGTALTPDHVAIVDIQPVDAEGEPTGPVQNGAQIILANPDLRAELRDALVGQTAGETVTVAFPHDHPEGEETDHEDHVDRYRVTVQTVQRRDVPEMTDEWVQAHTDGKVETVEGLREEARRELEENWDRRARQALESKMIEQFVAAHSFAVPEVLTDSALDAMLDEVREKMPEKQLPESFDIEGFRNERRAHAEDQVRWLLLKDALVHAEGLEVSNEDFEAEFERIAGDGENADMVRDFFKQQPQMLQQMGDHLLNQRIFSSLEGRFTVVDKTREDLEREAAARRAELEAAQDAE